MTKDFPSNSPPNWIRDIVREWRQWQQHPSDKHLLSGFNLQLARNHWQELASHFPPDFEEYLCRSEDREWQLATKLLSQTRLNVPQKTTDLALQWSTPEGLLAVIQEIGISLDLGQPPPPEVVRTLKQTVEGLREFGFVALGEGPIEDIAISHDGQWVAVACRSGVALLLDRKGTIVQQWQACEAGETRAVAFSPDGQQVVTGGSDGQLQLWALDGVAVGQPFCGHEGAVLSVAFSPDGTRIASTGSDLVVQLWTLAGKPLLGPLPTPRSLIRQVCFDPLGRWLLGVGSNGRLYLWNWREHRLDREIDTQLEALVAVGMDPTGDWAVAGGWDGRIFVWSVAEDRGISWPAHPGPIAAVVVDASGSVWSAAGEPGVKQWSSDGQLQRLLQGGSSDGTTAAAIAADGQWMVSGTRAGEVQLWDLQNSPQQAKTVTSQGGGDRLTEDWQLYLQLACDRLKSFPALLSLSSPTTRTAARICPP